MPELNAGRRVLRSRPVIVILMGVAGVVAGLGVIKGNPILIVGAMAVSPDLLPLCSACVGLVGGRRRLTRRALGTLLIGLALVGAAASLLTLVLQATGILTGDLVLGAGEASDAGGALVVLAVNVCLLIASGSATLAVQRRLSER